MNINFNDGHLTLTNAECFNLPLTLDCGQAFRWREIESGIWEGVAYGKYLKISQEKDKVIFYDTTPEIFDEIWKKYFGFDVDYKEITDRLIHDKTLQNAVKDNYGIRILRQEPWETLCSFIFSSSNNIKRIKGFIDKICRLYGDDLGNGNFTFPTAEKMAQISVEEFRNLGAGYRDKYLADGAAKVAGGEIDLIEISNMPTENARKELMKIKGVGKKVADCTLLFGFGHLEVCPVDVWIKRGLELYPDGLPQCFNGIQGLAQQYLFTYARENLG